MNLLIVTRSRHSHYMTLIKQVTSAFNYSFSTSEKKYKVQLSEKARIDQHARHVCLSMLGITRSVLMTALKTVCSRQPSLSFPQTFSKAKGKPIAGKGLHNAGSNMLASGEFAVHSYYT